MAKIGGSVLLLVLGVGVLVAVLGLLAGSIAAALLGVMLLSQRDGAPLRVRSLRGDELSPLGCVPEVARGVQVLEAHGPLLFTSAPKIDALLSDRPPWPSDLVLDLRHVTDMDGSALSALIHVLDCLEVRAGRFALVCQPRSQLFVRLQRRGLIARALGGTSCFTLVHALERIGARHRQEQRAAGASKRALGSLRLLHLPAEPGR